MNNETATMPKKAAKKTETSPENKRKKKDPSRLIAQFEKLPFDQKVTAFRHIKDIMGKTLDEEGEKAEKRAVYVKEVWEQLSHRS